MRGEDRGQAGLRLCFLVTHEASARDFYTRYLRHVTDAGHEVHLIACFDRDPADFAAATGAIIHPIDMRRRPAPLADLRALRTIERLLSEIAPDAVVYATPKAALIGALASRIRRVPVRMYQIWGLRLETVHGAGRLLLRALERVTAACSTDLVANSPSLAAEYRRQGLAGGAPVRVLGQGSSHGVDVEHFAAPAGPAQLPGASGPAQLPGTSTPLRIGFIGRITPDKGIPTLLDALRILATEGTPASCTFLGPVEDAALADDIDALAQEHPIQRLSEVADVRPHIREMDVVCLPSLREGFPNVVLEAAAAGVPAVVADSTGTVDSVVHEDTGLVFPTGDAQALAHALRRLADFRGLRMRLGRGALHRVREHFRQERIWALQLGLLTSLVGQARGRRPAALSALSGASRRA